ncbi:MAG: cryptochrome/photolyase family protein [Halobacteriaceae archaeon]
MTVLVLGDQLTRAVGPVADRDERLLLVESEAFGRRLPYHPHKLVAVYSAMRHFRDELRAEGRTVEYRQAATLGDGIAAHLDADPGDELVAMRPLAYGADDRLQEIVAEAGGDLTLVPDERFLCSPAAFDEWAEGEAELGHEAFYRFQRRRTGYLMDGDDPVGGQWNYDEENRETPPADYDPPTPETFPPDETTREVRDWVAATFDADWADPEPFRWPVTRDAALSALDDFAENRLADFGPYQDAMLGAEWALSHSLLSVPLNLGLLRPAEVIERVIAAHRERADVPINSVEGFVRQVLGWREFVRHAYRRGMPALADANRLDATAPLPDFYWTGDTDMACLADAVEGVRARGYAHHIERLMLLSNFALLRGVKPSAINRWFHAAFVDAFHWVVTPNVVEMGQYAADLFATKPYVSSANYVEKMSDHCEGCRFDPDERTGADACPFNALYWDFLDRHEDRLRSNPRIAAVYGHLDRMDDEELTAVRERAASLKERY